MAGALFQVRPVSCHGVAPPRYVLATEYTAPPSPPSYAYRRSVALWMGPPRPSISNLR